MLTTVFFIQSYLKPRKQAVLFYRELETEHLSENARHYFIMLKKQRFHLIACKNATNWKTCLHAFHLTDLLKQHF